MPVYLFAAACAVAVVVIASRLLRRTRGGTDDDAPDGATNGHAGSMLSALFLLAFAIAVVVPWTNADAARSNTNAEAQALVETYWAAGRLDPADATRTRAEVADYATFVRRTEWPLMRDHRRLSTDGWARLDRLRRETMAVPFKDGTESADARTTVLNHLTEVSAARHQRATDARAHPPTGLLIITLLTGLVVIVLPLLAGARPRGWALLPLGLMAALLAVGIYLTVDISHVFSGAIAVHPDAFSSVSAEFTRIGQGG
ncbi:bestrophin-like domain [Actinomadura harenae]|uniref:DUF4239 domain-containing protein n=1 Tax=Actinomadura harenae TaxID=2483351 RepID=A0A3M2L663_9ACTN|nr:DUF4239 domain-containing protein [Actinomadura harenae]RMI32033.1 DUF4239 domain-containing protein [Actinomadura harenae]